MEKIIYEKNDVNKISRIKISEKSEPALWNDANEARSRLVDILSALDDTLANLIISSESFDAVTALDIVKALRQVTLDQVCFLLKMLLTNYLRFEESSTYFNG